MTWSPVYDDPKVPCRAFAIIVHPLRPRQVLLVKNPDASWTLPSTLRNDQHIGNVSPLFRDITARHGMNILILQCIYSGASEVSNEWHSLYAAADLSSGSTIPSDCRWFSLEDFTSLTLEFEYHRKIVREWISQGDTGVQRRPWATASWLPTAEAWVQEQLIRIGLEPISPIQQLRTWERSCVLSLETSRGTVYFKAVPEIFRHEPILTLWLSERFPTLGPSVLAIDRKRRWLLMKACQGRALYQYGDIEVISKAVTAYSRLQRDLVEHRHCLLDLGVPERTLKLRESQIRQLFSSEAMTFSGLTTAEQILLKERYPQFLELVGMLESSGIPNSLEHGDFWAGNVVYENDPKFIDWSDASISHPFFSFASFREFGVQPMETKLADQFNFWEGLTKDYLAPWAAYAPAETLKTSLALARVLACVHFACIYYFDILPHITSKWEQELMVGYWLRRLVRSGTALGFLGVS